MEYKVGDRVKYDSEICTVTKVIESQGKFKYRVQSDTWFDVVEDEMIEGLVEEECPQDFIEKYCKSCCTQRCDRTKEYLNGCPYYNAYRCEKQNNVMEEETKPEPKFKVGDILFYRGETSGYLKVEEIREENGEIRYYETSRNIYLVENDPDVFADKVCSVETEETKSEDELLDDYEELTDRAFKGGYEKCKSDIELNGFQLPDGYIFKDENGNIINATKIVLEKKKKEYPKTYEECCKVLGVNPDNFLSIRNLYRDDGDEESTDYERDLLDKFGSLWELRICRDAYWKIAGEEMGLGKPWEPDWTNYNEYKFVIGVNENKNIKCYKTIAQFVLAFPTEEMRDAFYENFNKELEICKELL